MAAGALLLTPDVVNEAIGRSGLPGPVRHVFRALAPLIDWSTGEIPSKRALSITELQDFTGHSRRTVRNALYVLQEHGWVSRQPPPEDKSRREHAKTRTWMHLPGSALAASVRGRLTGPDHVARRKMYRERWQRWRGRDPAETPDWAADPALIALAARTLHRLTGRQVDQATAAATVATVLGGHHRGYFRFGPGPYLTKSIEKDPQRFLPTVVPPRHQPPAAKAAPEVTAAGAAEARALMRDRDRAPP